MKKRTLYPSLSDIVEEPIRGEIYSAERLEEYALYLAEHLRTDKAPQLSRPLLRRMKENGDKLLAAYRTLIDSIENKEAVSPAAEWLIDNFHIVEEQLREIKEDLPKSYYEELPKLSIGDLAGYPRIYALALALVAHTDSRLELETIRSFIRSFQTKSYLNIGELWAVAITLRLALVENARRVSLRVVWDRNQRNAANVLADEIIDKAKEPEDLKRIIEKISLHCGKNIETEYAFISQLAQRLRDQELDIWPALEYLENTLKKCDCTVEETVHREHQHQAANQITIANIISSMRLLSNINWKNFFEDVSLLDRDLAEDPTGHYQGMDFQTRDEYRHTIERIGKRTKAHERDIARKAVALAAQKNLHVGYFLKTQGLPELEKNFKYKPKWNESLNRGIRKRPTLFYLGVLVLCIVAILAIPLCYAHSHAASVGALIGLTVLLLIPCSDLAVSLVNFILTHLLKPRRLAKMDLTSGVPAEARTLVIIPCLLADKDTIQELIGRLEVHYLGNNEKNIYFSLVTDFSDAPVEITENDEELLQTALSGVARLNKTYGEHFFVFHRRRLWNEAEKKWMGWERKRGKIHELNRLLRGARDTSFVNVTAPASLLTSFRYVITLDADTQLGLDTAKILIGTALHPLNKAVYDAEKGRVVQGYGIIQPRISISLESSSHSTFSMIFSGHTGIDPYTTAISDVYQDLFDEGSFTGKGLYDIDAFEAALKDRVPENTILSHDLFEGLYARAALATDIELLDDYPSNYFSFVQRQHRWVRGDWQIARWVLPFVPDASKKRVRNTLPFISRWKIYDNLRRSLVALFLFLLFALGWLTLPGSAFFWTGFAALIVAFPCFLHVANGLFVSPRGIPWSSGFWTELGKTKMSLGQFLLSMVFLPHKAYVELDAIIRALYRSEVSGEKCLEWVASAQINRGQSHHQKPLWQQPWVVEGVLLLLLWMILIKGPLSATLLALPIILIWMSYPQVARITHLRLQKRKPELETDEKLFFSEVARRIWHFFETFVGPQDNWLPPDNIQEDPEVVIAHRTSPTNIGLYALALVSARDLGYLGLRGCLERLRSLLDTVKKLEKYEGHLLNWYDTQTLAPLYPKYVSVVDSGNLAGYLLAAKQSCDEFKRTRLFNVQIVKSMTVTVKLLEAELRLLQHQRQSTSAISATHLLERIEESKRLLANARPHTLREWSGLLRFLKQSFDDINDSVAALELEHGARHYLRLHLWIRSLTSLTSDLDTDIELYAPWIFSSYRNVETELRTFHEKLLPEWQAILEMLDQNLSVNDLSRINGEAAVKLTELKQKATRLSSYDIDTLIDCCRRANTNLQAVRAAADEVMQDCDDLFQKMNFAFLIDPDREVFSIGFNVGENRLDNAYYDLLASEARLASFISIIKGDVDQKHWFRLGRQLVPVEGGRALISWSASMFEYLMPQLIMKNYENTLLFETMQAVVHRQVNYGRKLKVPWGISEAGYNARDLNFNYQYGPFGIPGLGLKRGLGHDLVVSPYSSFLAAMVNPNVAVKNLKALAQQNILTSYGYYESIDYTPERLSADQRFSVIRSFMAHHQGMSLIAVNNVLHSDVMQERFHSEPRVRAAQLLLQERIPQKVALTVPKAAEIEWDGAGDSLLKSFSRVYDDASHHSPRVQILSNGKYSLMLSTAGSGYSKCEGLALTRWREDGTRDHWGSFVFIRDLDKKEVWSATFQPNIKDPEGYKAIFTEDKVEFWREDRDIRTHMQVIVAPEDDLELRQVSIINDSFKDRYFEVTSYMEPVLAPLAEDQAHPAFSNLFLQTEYLASKHTLIARRRPRLSKKSEVWGLHSVTSDGAYEGDIEYETDRARFIGRGKSLLNAAALTEGRQLSNTIGSTLDPTLCLRVRVRVPPGGTRKILFTTGIAPTRDKVLMMADRYHDIHSFDRESKLAWTKSRIDLRHLGMDSEAAYLFQRLAERILYSDSSLRQPSHLRAVNIREQASLWPYGISGDLPIVVLTVSDKKDMGIVRKLLRGHEYLRLKGLSYDFVILSDSKSTYLQELFEEVQRQIRYSGSQGWLNKPGGVFPLRLDTMPQKDRAFIQAMARVVLSSEWGTLKEQVARRVPAEKYASAFRAEREPRDYATPALQPPELDFFNGLGGFSKDGKEYVICLRDDQWTPAPWINVIANAHDFGFQVSETGAGFTWSVNSRENRLTPWSNDPVSDPSGEIFYLRDEETGEYWSPTPHPIRDSALYIIRHGQGYSKFEHTTKGVSLSLVQFVPRVDSVKISRLKIKNVSGRRRKISLWAYVEWVLGNQREKSAPYIFTETDESKTIFAKNAYNHEFAERISFFKINSSNVTFTCDRKEFLGRNGDTSAPEALTRQTLGGRSGVGHDPCGALQTVFELKEHEEIEVIILLGQSDKDSAQSILRKYQDAHAVDKAFQDVCKMWDEILGVIQVKTPDLSLNILMNHWLLYQAMVCRLWARSAFYQSGGAYGFRDQLQDCMAFVYATPELARAHILRASSRQFPEGDVQHWWHPPTGRGVRTHFSDDLLWLPFVVSHYIRVTGDEQILQEETPFIEAPLLTPEQEDSYTQPKVSSQKATLLDHCLRTIEHSLKLGAHGLPLIGCGDWNDGMNRVGEKGQGESVWMAWFLHKVLEDFLPFCDSEQKKKYSQHMRVLKENVEKNAWDGEWYRRAYFDDGTPIGSAHNEEARIDSLAQTWSVLSKAGDPERQLQGMESVDRHLILKDKKLILLLTPPFDKTSLDPGYIKGYVPGVRENGGQYTHAALWVMMAYAELREKEKVYSIFNMLNPIHHTRNREGVHKYKIEPYVVAADVYAVEPHVGRGGWSWYTGSASWFYRAGLESLLGFERHRDRLVLKPCVPSEWPYYEIHYRYKSSFYKIRIEQSAGRKTSEKLEVQLVDDGKTHEVVFKV
ncbi:glucoamylase family protein [Bdellovibrio sp. 22V]|uniref:GH36-type glycosyl hydrolase domain-containing protein n=1 Tax=Bdellovibrio sp. 22V TaxID=3044166 RepID=UPI002543D8BE|nr:glucoamylase family protein [Bdellovibrio sp. 22V]WII73827.1 glucoamylase family protein [Bdellovibrio sp. 22V]